MTNNSIDQNVLPADIFKSGQEELRNNIWPRSFPLWVALGYLVLTIIRPWEILFPWMAAVRFELLYLLFMLVTVHAANHKQPVMCLHTVAVLFFLGSLLLCWLTAVSPPLAWNEIYKYLPHIIFYFVLLVVVRTPYQLVFTFIVYISSLFLYLAKAQWEFFVHGRHRYTMGVIRLTGVENSFGGPNALAMTIVVSLPFALFLWRQKKYFTVGWPLKWQKNLALMLKLYALLAVSSIILTNSRSGMLSFVFFMGLVCLGVNGFLKKLGLIVGGILFLGLLWLMMPAENQHRLQSIWNPEAGPENAQASAEGRVAGFWSGVAMFSQHPFTGVGPGNFVAYRVENLDGVPLQSHNLAGQALGETGLVGIISFLFMTWVTWRSCGKIKRITRGEGSAGVFWADFSTACRYSLLLLFFTGLFGHNLYRYNWLWITAFTAIALRHLVNGPEKPADGYLREEGNKQ